MMLLPPSLEELIPEAHPVRVVNRVIDKIDLTPILEKYEGGGTSSYHPKMLLKVLVYGYLSNIYSSRKIESAIKENIHFMWLSGMNTPDHHTINRFRSDRLKGVLKEVFTSVVLLMADEGLVDIKQLYTDGTKIEANANKYSFVWGKSIKNSRERIAKQLEELWDYTQQIAKEELGNKPKDFTPVSADQVEKTIEKINNALKDKPVDKKVKQKLTYAKKNWPDKIKQYQEAEKILGKRNSYSKTDKDATFMRMKEDHMQNGQLKPGYNLQISSNKQIIVHYTIHQNPTDTTTLIPHLESYKKYYQTSPDTQTADAGYGSEENYEYLENKKTTAYVKYNYFHKEQKQKDKVPISSTSQLHYEPEKDVVYCPMGQKMKRIGTRKRTTENGYQQTSSIYQAQNCKGCPLRSSCHKQEGNRKIELNHNLRAHKQKAKELLLSEEGIAHRKQRCWDVEAIFGNIKFNKKMKRFMLRGLEKVEVETGLIALAHNLAKMAG